MMLANPLGFHGKSIRSVMFARGIIVGCGDIRRGTDSVVAVTMIRACEVRDALKRKRLTKTTAVQNPKN
jgi:hypothetical protein